MVLSRPVIKKFFEDPSSLPSDWVDEIRHALIADYLTRNDELGFPEFKDQVEIMLMNDPVAKTIAEQFKKEQARFEEYLKSPEGEAWLQKKCDGFMKLTRAVSAKPNDS